VTAIRENAIGDRECGGEEMREKERKEKGLA